MGSSGGASNVTRRQRHPPKLPPRPRLGLFDPLLYCRQPKWGHDESMILSSRACCTAAAAALTVQDNDVHDVHICKKKNCDGEDRVQATRSEMERSVRWLVHDRSY